MSVEDWLRVFRTTSGWLDQVEIIEERQQQGKALATWERNCLRAYRQLFQRAA
jgi:hypothetical protein